MGITPQQFKQMQSRLSGAGRKASPLELPVSATVNRGHQLILGLDPSLRGTGFGVIRLMRPFPQTLAQGTISCPAGWPLSQCLAHIVRTVRALLEQHRPTICVVEGLFY